MTELSLLQALLLREQGGAGQLGGGHHQDEGKTGASACASWGRFNEQDLL